MPKVYEAPGAKTPKPNMTFFQVVVGRGAVFEPDPSRRVRFSEVLDAQDSTILLTEAAEPVEWTRPADLIVEPNKPLPKLGGLSPDGFNVCFVNGHVQYLKQDICRDDALMRALITRDGGELVNLRP